MDKKGACEMDYKIAIAYIFAVIILYITFWVFYKPLRHVMKIIVNSAIGCAALIGLNYVGAWAGIKIGINLYTAVIAGTLGAPGVGLILIMQRIFA
jgi:inhibitor of the pro-sigma K processing machinery